MHQLSDLTFSQLLFFLSKFSFLDQKQLTDTTKKCVVYPSEAEQI